MLSDELSGRDEEDVSETFVPLLVSVFSSPPQAAAIASKEMLNMDKNKSFIVLFLFMIFLLIFENSIKVL